MSEGAHMSAHADIPSRILDGERGRALPRQFNQVRDFVSISPKSNPPG
jgi:hypothetical protein